MTDVEQAIRAQALDIIRREYTDPTVTDIRLAASGRWRVDLEGTRWGARKRLRVYVVQPAWDPDAVQVEGAVIELD